jgi:DNA-directed RNA polymerase subunit K/omega
VSARWTRPALAAPGKEVHVVSRPDGSNAFEFVVVSALRAAQLMRGCVPRVAIACKHTTTAQLEVAAGKVAKVSEPFESDGS